MNERSRPARRLPNIHSIGSKTSRPGGQRALVELVRSLPCDDPRCATVLAGPGAEICEDFAEAFERVGVTTGDRQLELPEIQPEERAA
jgi:hypothetical protein